MSTTSSAPRRAVYRALLGGYERLREEEVAHDSEIPFICFTDDPGLTSTTWQVELVEPRLPRDSTRSARALKILGHPLLEAYDETLWVDNTVALTSPPDELFDLWLDDADVAAPLHSYRSSVLAEAEVVIDTGLDDFGRVYEQLAHYLAEDADVLEQNPHWTGILARRRSAATEAAMRAWWEDVLRYSRRDQLSFMPVMRTRGIRLHSVEVDTMESRWHQWPRAEGRDTTRQGSGLREALRPAPARVGELEQQLDSLTHTLTTAVAQREQVISELEDSLTSARQEVSSLRSDLDTVRHERNLAARDVVRMGAQVEALEARVERLAARNRRLRRRMRQRADAAPAPAPPAGGGGLGGLLPAVRRRRPD